MLCETPVCLKINIFFIVDCNSAEAAAAEERTKHEQEKNKMAVMLKRAELRITSLQNTVTKEQAENKELQALIDHLTSGTDIGTHWTLQLPSNFCIEGVKPLPSVWNYERWQKCPLSIQGFVSVHVNAFKIFGLWFCLSHVTKFWLSRTYLRNRSCLGRLMYFPPFCSRVWFKIMCN